MLGFPDKIPLDPPVSIIDFHGLQDVQFPYALGYYGTIGKGPYNSILTWWNFYILQKQQVLRMYKRSMGCSSPRVYPTKGPYLNDVYTIVRV